MAARTTRRSSAARLSTCTGRPDATLRGIAADLGISRHTLQVWVHALDPELDPARQALILRQAAKYFAGETNW